MNDILKEVIAELEWFLGANCSSLSKPNRAKLEQIIAIGKTALAPAKFNLNQHKAKIPVRLWVTHRLPIEGGDWPVRCSQAEPNLPGWQEIKFDETGPFIEVHP